MASFLTVTGVGEFDDKVIASATFCSDTPDDSNARSQDLSNTLLVRGRILTANDAEQTKLLAEWANLPQIEKDCYREVTLKVKAAGKTMREINFSHAFVVDYQEDFFDTEGVGTFEIKLRQKKDMLESVKIEGNYGE